jgi:Domain of Unknown Function (DUF1080)
MFQTRIVGRRNRRFFFVAIGVVAFGAAAELAALAMNREYLTGIKWSEPPVVTPGENGSPPSDAIVLFDGKDLSAWEGGEDWKVEDGVAIDAKHDIKTKQSFGDCQLHIEWSAPDPPHGQDQDRGNSGVFMQDRYEIQVLDSYINKTYFDGQASAVYKQTPPMVNAMRPPGKWNVYDIIWTAPKFKEDGSLDSPAFVTVLHNGIVTLNHFQVLGDTPWAAPPKYEAHGPAPIKLQFHNHPVRFRNIWVRELKPVEGHRVEEPFFHDHDSDRKWPVSAGETPPEKEAKSKID